MRVLLPIWLTVLCFNPSFAQQYVAPTTADRNSAARIEASRTREPPAPLTLQSALEPLTLGRAWDIAEQSNPDLRRAQAELVAAESEATEARPPLRYNPVATIEPARRRLNEAGSSDRKFEGGVGIAQTFEIAGQQVARRAAAGDNLSAVQATIDETLRQLRAGVESRFVRVLSLQQRLETEQRLVNLIEDAAAAVRKRVDAGEDSRLDGNLARVEAERARNQLTQIKEQLIVARAELAAALQLPPQNLPEVSGTLEREPQTYTLDELIAAVENRPILRALQFGETAARSRLDLERALRYPDLTLGLSHAKEAGFGGNDRITSLNLSLPLPVFYRNAARIGRASTELAQAQIERQTTNRDARAQVIALWQQLETLRTRVARLNESVVSRLEDNQRLSALAYREGEIGVIQLLLVQRQNVDIQRDLLDARTDLRQTQIALEAAAGWALDVSAQKP